MSDVLDILDANRPQVEDTPMGPPKRGPKPKPPKPQMTPRRKPEGMHRELYALLNTSDSDAPLLPTDFAIGSKAAGYKQVRANLSIKKPRKWLWTPFLNPARKDHLQLNHWRRVTDPNEPPKEYQFAKYNTKIDSHISKYDGAEYNRVLHCDQWTKEETDHLMELCTRFDLRFNVIHDRWDRVRFKTERSVEDLKERYYFVYNQLSKHRAFIDVPKIKEYDSQHERKRKQQLLNLYNRTKEQIEEEANLINELKKIEQKKKDRERKTQDLQKIMDAAGRSSSEHTKRTEHSNTPTVGRPSGSGTAASLLEADTVGIKFPDFKTSGTSLRSQRLKLPTSLGTKKMKALEQMIHELGLDQSPMPTEAICQSFNELRSDLLLLYELKVNLANTDFETQSIRNQLAMVKPELAPAESASAGGAGASGKDSTSASSSSATAAATAAATAGAPSATTGAAPVSAGGSTQDTSGRDISDVIDINAVNTPGRKRKAALEQSNVLRKLKKTL